MSVSLGSAASAEAAFLRVPDDYVEIQQGLNAAQKGDTVRVAEGVFYENVSMKDGVILEGGWNKDFSHRDPAAFVSTIDGIKNGGWVVFGANNAVLDGFTIINGSLSDQGGATSGAGIHCRLTSPIIRNNIIRNNEPGGIYCKESAATIENNRIYENEKAGIYAERGSDLKIYGNTIRDNKMSGIGTGDLPASKLDVRNNRIHHNLIAGINLISATGTFYNNIIYENARAGIRCNLMPVEIINNTITANYRAGIMGVDPSLTPLIKNNIISHNQKSGIKLAAKGYAYNLLYANNLESESYPEFIWSVRRQFSGYEDEESYLTQHNIIADPLYVDATAHDFHLRPVSPGIDAGDSAALFNDKYFGPSMGAEVNDLGAYGGPFAVSETGRMNHSPQANPGASQTVYIEDEVSLDASGSADPDGDTLFFFWGILSKPPNSVAALSDENSATTSFIADMPGEFTVQLRVRDRFGAVSDPQTVTIIARENRPPTAKIGAIRKKINLGDVVTLPLYDSGDADGDTLTYKWELTYKPIASRTSLAGSTSLNPTLAVDAPGCYTLQLTVNDGTIDSIPDSAHFCTDYQAQFGIRDVPGQYPTIQTAIDSSFDGDIIIVQKGIYKENVIVDRVVNLIGVDWPVIDGGTTKGSGEALHIFYVGEDAGQVQGFVITGGGTAPLGHGIRIWNSSPEIFNNKIMRNGYVGVGIHGKERLTRETRIHDNFIFENMVGVGNGLGCGGQIYRNYIYDNRIAGVGAKGLSSPIISGNKIYGNFTGVGSRGVAFPHIDQNNIYDNVFGISINQVRPLEPFEPRQVQITGNFVSRNQQGGIFVSSLNSNPIVVSENTVDSNNHESAELERGGGIIIGYPQHPRPDTLAENNFLSNNKNYNQQNYSLSGLTSIVEPERPAGYTP
nr:right-handed parallel beta-helix repeat-containing protein [Desulfobulbaceae bacterium]